VERLQRGVGSVRSMMWLELEREKWLSGKSAKGMVSPKNVTLLPWKVQEVGCGRITFSLRKQLRNIPWAEFRNFWRVWILLHVLLGYSRKGKHLDLEEIVGYRLFMARANRPFPAWRPNCHSRTPMNRLLFSMDTVRCAYCN